MRTPSAIRSSIRTQIFYVWTSYGLVTGLLIAEENEQRQNQYIFWFFTAAKLHNTNQFVLQFAISPERTCTIRKEGWDLKKLYTFFERIPTSVILYIYTHLEYRRSTWFPKSRYVVADSSVVIDFAIEGRMLQFALKCVFF